MSTSKVKKSSLVGSASTVSAVTALSRILGLIREQVMAWFFGAGVATDAFVTAFRVPNLLRDMFAEGALSSAFVPVFKEKLVTRGDKDAFRLADVVITAILVVVGLIVLLGIVAAPAIIYIFANGFTAEPDKFDLTVSLTRVMMVYLLLVSLSALVMGMLNSFGRFGLPAISPAMFNLGTIVTVVVLYRYFDQPIYTLALGVVIGGLGQVAIQLPPLLKIGYRFRLSCRFLDEGLKRVVRLIGPMIIGLSAGRINILVSTLLASFMVHGAISYLNYSYRLMHFPLGVFAVAIGTVALPKVSAMVARGETENVSRTWSEVIGINLFVVIPSAVFLALMGPQVVDLIYQWGAFTPLASERTALALLHYSYGLVGFAAVRVTVPFFYACNDSRLPMRISVASVALNLVLYYPFIKMLDFAGLAAATSIAGIANFLMLLFFLPSKGIHVSFGRLGLKFLRILLAALAAFYIARLVPYGFIGGGHTVEERLLGLTVPMFTAGLLYLIFCFVFRLREITLLKRVLFREPRVKE